MQAILEMGIENILWMQQFQTPLTYTFWKIFTNFGGTYYLWMVPALLWCVDYRVGLRVVLMLTLTLVLNAVLKEAFAAPRPFEVDSRILSPGEQGYGLPSGHAQLAVVFWGLLAGWVRHRWFSLFAAVMMLLMVLSRVVLGVHFPTDVLAGWALGLLSLWWYFRYQAGFVLVGEVVKGRVVHPIESSVEAAQRDQLVVVTFFDQSPMVQNEYPVAFPDCGQAVCNHDRSASL